MTEYFFAGLVSAIICLAMDLHACIRDGNQSCSCPIHIKKRVALCSEFFVTGLCTLIALILASANAWQFLLGYAAVRAARLVCVLVRA